MSGGLKLKILKLIFSGYLLFFCPLAFCQKESRKGGRIGSLLFDHSKVYTIELHIGRVSLIRFPCAIQKATLGSPKDVTATVSSHIKEELFLWLKTEKARSTNLIVNCSKNTFVFDVKPSKFNHQDYLKIILSFETPALKNKTKKVHENSAQKTLKVRGRVYKIIKSTNSKGEDSL